MELELLLRNSIWLLALRNFAIWLVLFVFLYLCKQFKPGKAFALSGEIKQKEYSIMLIVAVVISYSLDFYVYDAINYLAEKFTLNNFSTLNMIYYGKLAVASIFDIFQLSLGIRRLNNIGKKGSLIAILFIACFIPYAGNYFAVIKLITLFILCFMKRK